MIKLKPVVFIKGRYGYNAQNTTQQIMLLRALRITQDPQKLKELIGVRTAAEVFRMLDKISIRKEYHAALVRLGVSFDYIVKNLKKEIDEGEKSADRIKAISIFLKSVGLDKYEETVGGGGGWEEALLKLSDGKKEKDDKKVVDNYEVVQPIIPESVRIAKEREKLEGRSLYE